MQTDHAHIQSLLKRAKLFLMEGNMGFHLEIELNKLLWLGSSIDWNALPNHRAINQAGLSSQQLLEAIVQTTHFADYAYAVVFYSSKEPLLFGQRDDVLLNLDQIFWKAPRTRFVFAAEKQADVVLPEASTFLEYSGGDLLHFSR